MLEVSKHRTEKEGSMALLEALNSERNPWPFVEIVASGDRNGHRLLLASVFKPAGNSVSAISRGQLVNINNKKN